jgi:hypothetical protein
LAASADILLRLILLAEYNNGKYPTNHLIYFIGFNGAYYRLRYFFYKNIFQR